MIDPMRRRGGGGGTDGEFEKQSMETLSSSDSRSTYDTYDSEKEKKPERRQDYRQEIFLSIFPAFLILLVFGGRPALLTLAFGGLFCYIFDLLGSIEVRT